MLGPRIVIDKRSKDEGEKPFWISYADLMTALMALFLVTMATALIHVQQKLDKAESKESEQKRKEKERTKEINEFWSQIEKIIDPAIKIDRIRGVIDFGKKAHFDTNKDSLDKPEVTYLRGEVFKIVESEKRIPQWKWVKRFLVEGYTDSTGSYLYNLNLSLNRAKRVVCALLKPDASEKGKPGNKEIKSKIRELFFIGGFSFNNLMPSDEMSRRVELKLEFLGVGEEKVKSPTNSQNDDVNCDEFWFVKSENDAVDQLYAKRRN